jgi:hypothetical protein
MGAERSGGKERRRCADGALEQGSALEESTEGSGLDLVESELPLNTIVF